MAYLRGIRATKLMIHLAYTYMHKGSGTYDLTQRVQNVDRLVVTRTHAFREYADESFACRYTVEFWDTQNDVRRGSVDFTTRLAGISAPPLMQEVPDPVTEEDIADAESEDCQAYTDEEIHDLMTRKDS